MYMYVTFQEKSGIVCMYPANVLGGDGSTGPGGTLPISR